MIAYLGTSDTTVMLFLVVFCAMLLCALFQADWDGFVGIVGGFVGVLPCIGILWLILWLCEWIGGSR